MVTLSGPPRADLPLAGFRFCSRRLDQMASGGVERDFYDRRYGACVSVQRWWVHRRLVHVLSPDGTCNQNELRRRERVLLLLDVLPALCRQSRLRDHSSPRRRPILAFKAASASTVV